MEYHLDQFLFVLLICLILWGLSCLNISFLSSSFEIQIDEPTRKGPVGYMTWNPVYEALIRFDKTTALYVGFFFLFLPKIKNQLL